MMTINDFCKEAVDFFNGLTWTKCKHCKYAIQKRDIKDSPYIYLCEKGMNWTRFDASCPIGEKGKKE